MQLSIISSDDIEIYNTNLQSQRNAILEVDGKVTRLSILDWLYEHQKGYIAKGTYQQFYHYPHPINNSEYYLFQTYSQDIIILQVPAQQAT